MSLPRGIRNNNPLNIRKGAHWQGLKEVQTDSQFAQFVSTEMGLRAAFVLLRNYISGFNGQRKPCDTIEKIISRWAPSVENATEAYINHVSVRVGIHRATRIKFEDRQTMCSLVYAMAEVETGTKLDPELINSAYSLV